MTTFQDGPAKGQRLMLRRAPIFLRVVVDNKGVVDALDQPDDEPWKGETCYAYQLAEVPGSCFMRPGGHYPIATYRVIEPQPAQSEMSTIAAWINWVERNKQKAIVQP